MFVLVYDERIKLLFGKFIHQLSDSYNKCDTFFLQDLQIHPYQKES
jgi:hypothetical protein